MTNGINVTFISKLKRYVRPHLVRITFSNRSGPLANNMERVISFVDKRRRYQLLRAVRMQMLYSLNKKDVLEALCWEEVENRPNFHLLRHLLIKSSMLFNDEELVRRVLEDVVGSTKLPAHDMTFLAMRRSLYEPIEDYSSKLLQEARTNILKTSPQKNPGQWNYYILVLEKFESFDFEFPPDFEDQLNEYQAYRLGVYRFKKSISEREWQKAEAVGKQIIWNKSMELDPINQLADVSLYTGNSKEMLPLLLWYRDKEIQKLVGYDYLNGLRLLQDDDVIGYLRLRAASPINKDIIKHLPRTTELIAGDNVQPYDAQKKGKSLFVIGRDGVGDEVRWSQFYGVLPKYYSKVDISCDSRLESIFKRSFPEITFHPVARNWGRVNAQTQSQSFKKVQSLEISNRLDYASFQICRKANEVSFNEDVANRYYMTHGVGPVGKPYLFPREDYAEHWQHNLSKVAGKRLKIGIVWRSGLTDARRSQHYLRLSDFSPLRSQNVKLFSLQHGMDEDELKRAKNMGVHVFEDVDLYNDFETILALTSQMDVVIGISTLPLELAAASGTPVKLCIPSPFGKLLREDSKNPKQDRLTYNTKLYYPTSEDGFNQPRHDIADQIIEQVAQDIEEGDL